MHKGNILDDFLYSFLLSSATQYWIQLLYCSRWVPSSFFCSHFHFLLLHNIEFLCSYAVVDECLPQFFVSTSSLEPLPPSKHVTLNILFFSLQIRSLSKFLLFSTFLTYVTICVADQMQKCHQVAFERLHCWWKGLEGKQSLPEKMTNFCLDMSLQQRRKCAAKN